jgi:hypothetical protein
MTRIYTMAVAASAAALLLANPAAAQPTSIDCQSDDGKGVHAETFYFTMGGTPYLKNGDLDPNNRSWRRHLETAFGGEFPQARCT